MEEIDVFGLVSALRPTAVKEGLKKGNGVYKVKLSDHKKKK